MATAAPAMSAAPAAEKDNTKWLIAITVALGALLEIVDTSIVNVALTDMQASLGATLSEIGWVVTAYAIANVIILPLTAWLGERFGKKRYFIFSLVGFTMSSVLCGLSHSLMMLIVARVLQGLTGGGLLAKAQSILFETFPKEEQAMAQALFGAVVIAGPTIGPTLGGYIVTNLDWRWIFFINVPIGVAAVMMCITFLPADPKEKKAQGSVDWIAIALLAIGIGSLQTFLEQGQENDWFESRFIAALFFAAIISLVLFVRRQLEAAHPVVDLRVLRHRSLWAGCILSAVVGMGLYGALFAVPIFAQSMMHMTAQQTGMLLLPGALCSAVAMPLVGRLLQKFDPRYVLGAGCLILTLAVYELSWLSPMSGEHSFFWPLIIRAFGTTMMFLPLSLVALGTIPKKDVAAATGIYNLTRQLGGSIGIAGLTLLLDRREQFHSTVLGEKLVMTSPSVLARVNMMTQMFVSKGFDVVNAKAKALAMLAGSVKMQSAVIAFGDTFTITVFLLLGSLPLLLLLEKPQKGAKVDAGH